MLNIYNIRLRSVVFSFYRNNTILKLIAGGPMYLPSCKFEFRVNLGEVNEEFHDLIKIARVLTKLYMFSWKKRTCGIRDNLSEVEHLVKGPLFGVIRLNKVNNNFVVCATVSVNKPLV